VEGLGVGSSWITWCTAVKTHSCLRARGVKLHLTRIILPEFSYVRVRSLSLPGNTSAHATEAAHSAEVHSGGRLRGMGNSGSTLEGHHFGQPTYSAGPSTTYVPGTTLPTHGWLQPCAGCSTTTARTVGTKHKFLCRR
jgi:hypothetical protein